MAGSGIAAQRLSTDTGLQLLENSIATTLGLGVLIVLLAPISGAHFNPVVSAANTLLGQRTGTGRSRPPRPSCALNSGARRVQITKPSGSGSPEATPNVNG